VTHEQAFLQAILDRPEDDTPRLVFADFLEDRGDPRAPVVRRHPALFRFLAGLRAAPAPDVSLRQLEEWTFGGQANLVRGLALLLDSRYDLQELPGVANAIVAQLRQALTLAPDHGTAEPLLRDLAATPGDAADRASRLAALHPPAVLLALLEGLPRAPPCLKLAACLAQEMVLRGVILEGMEAGEHLHALLRERKHHLARLPLSLTAVDGDLRPWLPRYGEGADVSWALPASPSQPLPSTEGASLPSLAEASDLASSARIAAAVRDWPKVSNGVVATHLLRADRPLAESDLALGLLQSLGLPCLEGELRAERVSPQGAFALLFSAASSGCAYSHGLKGAYGRLAAWQSVAGLVGAAEGADVTTVAELAQQCRWVSFGASSGWFYELIDLGLLAVRPDGRTMAVLAATDTD
jgi:uncharacterized protein (TIGR02996 family)